MKIYYQFINFYVGHVKIAELLIKNGADINSTDKIGGQTPLHYCIARDRNSNATSDRLEIAQLLIDSGANQDISDKFGHNVLQLAIQNGL